MKQQIERQQARVYDLEARDGRKRTVIEGVSPEIDAGRFPVKRVSGETVVVEADIFTDGHEALSAVLLYRFEPDEHWSEIAFEPLVNDRWSASFQVEHLGRYVYTIEAWIDHFKGWRRDLFKKIEAEQDIKVDILIGAELVDAASGRASGEDQVRLHDWATRLRSRNLDDQQGELALSEELSELVNRYPDRSHATRYSRELEVVVDRPRARFSSWYEIFPRSTGAPGTHGTFRDVEKMLPYISAMGFDVLYFPPIHPIGMAYRKGPNNTLTAGPDDTGSPWAIGSEDGGHMSIHPQLGTLEDFQHLVQATRKQGLEIALDIAFQASPDHPYVTEHPEWFKHRPDGSIQYAENPPKKYQDIYPFDFESEDWQGLWQELRAIFQYWIDQGVRIFRVDNPHTKAFPFWEWCIGSLKAENPETIFLSEAFTRPKVMYQLAKLGFTQSYTYFAWRNTKWELTEYFTELTQTQVREFFRPNLWPNTPDILTEHLQTGLRQTFATRLILAATLGASYGIYGPAFELLEHRPLIPGREEYLDSEKYQIREWQLDRPESLQDLIGLVNSIRHENPALQQDRTLVFHPVDNEQIIAYSKTTEDLSNIILTVVNLDPHHSQSGWLNLNMAVLDLDPSISFQVHDLLTEDRHLWHGAHNFVQLNPHVMPAHIFVIHRRVKMEQDFEYFM